MNTIRRVSQNITTSVGIRQKKDTNDTGEMNEEILLQNVKDKINIIGIQLLLMICYYCF